VGACVVWSDGYDCPDLKPFVSGFEKRAHIVQNAKTWRHQEPLASVFVYRHPALLLKKSNIRKCSYLLTWNSGAPRWGIKWPISTMCDTCNNHAQTRSGWDTKFTASVVQWLKNSYTQFQACSYYSLEVMLNYKQKFCLCTKWVLFLNLL